jgi:methylated-DNA-protein-cysteine methyltransferase related protein
MLTRMKDSLPKTFSQRACEVIKKIPRGKVATYGQVAALAGNPLAARQIAWVLNSNWRSDNLPWHRIIGGKGRISLMPGNGYETQRSLLLREGIKFGNDDSINLDLYQWNPKRAHKRK